MAGSGSDDRSRKALQSPIRTNTSEFLKTPEASPWREWNATALKSNSMLVMKFSGSALAGVEDVRRAADLVLESLPRLPVVVLSAMATTTNDLLKASEAALERGAVDISSIQAWHESMLTELKLAVPAQVANLFEELKRILAGVAMVKELSPQTRDRIVSFGERLSVRLFVTYLNSLRGEQGVEARALDSWDVGILTTTGMSSMSSTKSEVQMLPSVYSDVASHFESLGQKYSYVPVVTGYISKDLNGKITTLGRGGSDQTAAIIGAALAASEIQIWKGAGGITTADAQIVPAARPVDLLSFEEVAELSSFGGTYIVHPAAVLPAWQAQVPISIRSISTPADTGTRIVATLAPQSARKDRVTAICCKRGVTLIVMRSTRMLGQHGFLARVFQLFDQFGVSVDVIATSEVTVSLTLDQNINEKDMSSLLQKLEEVATIEVTLDLAMLILITAKSSSASVLHESFNILEELKVPVEMLSHGASNVNITFILPDSGLAPCVQRLHAHFFDK